MKGCPGMIAIVLDEPTKDRLREQAIHPNVFCRYITVAYRPRPDIYAKYKHLLGLEITFSIYDIVQDEKGQAAIVDGAVMTENVVPHVTISCAEGIKPNYSNDLLSGAHKKMTSFRLEGRGTVQYVPL